ncbi:hypothetical protein TIFTF001_018453 [Ficus carica]|uniref:Uncharacterized protein n=1 Tax=Ficus carica TaxID=3494 RepID=A0AA88D999_FICCA|nr:hypothetical protein TIFTF001_018453 [Ficus carica]
MSAGTWRKLSMKILPAPVQLPGRNLIFSTAEVYDTTWALLLLGRNSALQNKPPSENSTTTMTLDVLQGCPSAGKKPASWEEGREKAGRGKDYQL